MVLKNPNERGAEAPQILETQTQKLARSTRESNTHRFSSVSKIYSLLYSKATASGLSFPTSKAIPPSLRLSTKDAKDSKYFFTASFQLCSLLRKRA